VLFDSVISIDFGETNMTKRTGRCLCGAVSFTLTTEPIATRICWCRDCQHIAANGTVNLLVNAEGISVSGELTEYIKTAESGNQITHQFCPSCGAHLLAMSSARPQFRVLRAGNLDDPSSIQPSMNIWAESAPSWACMSFNLERVEKQPLPPKPSLEVQRG
jgi:hypothetical protein